MIKTVVVKGYGKLDGEFSKNIHGWFCSEVNGIEWDYKAWGIQTAKKTPAAAAAALISAAEEFDQ